MSNYFNLYFLTFLTCLVTGNLFAQLKVGDSGITVNRNSINQNRSDYPQMDRWSKAGVEGGIPFPNDSGFQKFSSINPGNSNAINNAINQLSNTLRNGERGLLTLKNGNYNINGRINMKSNVSITGETREGVICTIDIKGGSAFYFSGIQNAGVYSLTVNSILGVPKYKWNYGINQNDEVRGNDNVTVLMRDDTRNCWLDKVTLLNAVKDPLRCNAKHNTFRDLIVDGAHKKAGGAQGYFFILNSDNLITGCSITHLRHISLQGDNVEFNVVYDNDFKQEVSFHSGDDVNNLIENNRITLPSDMPPVAPGDTVSTPFREARSGKPIYFAIMGPWSSRHRNSAKPNWIYRNDCVQFNHDFGPRRPWSDSNIVYTGPKKLGLSTQERIDNFPNSKLDPPVGGTLYAINLGNPDPVVTPDPDPVTPDPITPPACVIGASCNDGDICTINDKLNADCDCIGILASTRISNQEITSVEDAFIQSGSGVNSDILRVNEDSRVTYIKYDLRSVSETNNIALELTVARDGGNGTIKVYRADGNSWTENNLSSSNAPNKLEEIGTITGTYREGQVYKIEFPTLTIASSTNFVSLIVEQSSGNDVSFESSSNALKGPKLSFSATSPCQSTLSLAEVSEINTIDSKFEIYPNPTTGNVTFSLPTIDVRKEATLTIVNILGATVAKINVTKSNSSIDVNLGSYGLSSGIYFVNYSYEEKTITEKMIVE